MLSRQKIITLTLLSALIVGYTTAAYGTEYPNQEGYVTDKADMFSSNFEENLESELSTYDGQTHIEIAVCSVPTLGSETADRYTQNLATMWGVGEAKNNNGIVILLAKAERKLTVLYGDGFDKAYSLKNSDYLVNQLMIPNYLKKGQVEAGITAGLTEMKDRLEREQYTTKWVTNFTSESRTPTDTYVPPTSRQREYYPQTPAAPSIPAQPMSPETAGAIGLLLGVAVLFGFGIYLWSSIWGKRDRHRAVLADYTGTKEELTKKADLAAKAIDSLRDEFSESIWGQLRNDIDLAGIQNYLCENPEKLNTETLLRGCTAMAGHINSCQAVIDLLTTARKAKEDVITQIRELPREVKVVAKALEHPDVLPETKESLVQLRANIEDLCQPGMMASPDDPKAINWIQLDKNLQRLEHELGEIRKQADDDQQRVSQARRQIPALIQDLPGRIQLIRDKNSGQHSDVEDRLARAEAALAKAQNQSDTSQLSTAEILILGGLLNNAYDECREADSTYARHHRPDPPIYQAPSYSPPPSSYETPSPRHDDNDDEGGRFGSNIGGGGSSGSWSNDSPSDPPASGGTFTGTTGGGGKSGGW